MGKTKIEWTAGNDGTLGKTWNPVRGCVKVSPGCKNCYAETFAERWRGIKGHPYEQGFDLRLVPEKLGEPLRWKKPARIFVNSMSDLFQDGVPDEYIDKVFGVMAFAPQHTFQVLTKRAERMREYCSELAALSGRQRSIRIVTSQYKDHPAEYLMRGIKDENVGEFPWPLKNVWLGVSAEDQERANERILPLLQTPAAVRFVSYEPSLGPINFSRIEIEPPGSGGTIYLDVLKGRGCSVGGSWDYEKLDWVIVGGESGPGARPFNINWARMTVKDCAAAGVACFVKQLGARPYACRQSMNGKPDHRTCIEDRLEGMTGKGGSTEEWPEELRVRQFPEQVSPSGDSVARQR